MYAFAAFEHCRMFLIYLNFPGIFHRRGDGFANHPHTVFRDEGRCPTAFRCMQLAKRAGEQPRVVFRFATHVPHLFLIMTTENHRISQKATYFSHANGKNCEYPPAPAEGGNAGKRDCSEMAQMVPQ